MELDITHMIDDADEMPTLSGSIAELGNEASRLTWTNSMAYGQSQPLLHTDDERDAARAHFREYGTWSEDEIAAWSEDHLQAIMCQDVAAAIREREAFDSDEAFQQACESGRASGRIYRGDDGHWYFYLGI
jgi:hypothetical protein